MASNEGAYNTCKAFPTSKHNTFIQTHASYNGNNFWAQWQKNPAPAKQHSLPCIYLNIQDINIEFCDPILVLQESVLKTTNEQAELKVKQRNPHGKGKMNYLHYYIP